MDKTPATWTLMNTSRTYTTSHGYSTTTTLADAMRNRVCNQLTNLGKNFRALALWMAIAAQKPAAKKASKRIGRTKTRR